MKDIAIDVFLASKNKLNPNKRRNCFELVGFDFMIDEDFRTWLIEVNTNPSLQIHNKGLRPILPKMMNELFNIVLDPVFETHQPRQPLEQGTGFDCLYSRSRGIHKRRKAAEGVYPVPELDCRKLYKRPKIRLKVKATGTDLLNTSQVSREQEANNHLTA